MELDLDEMYAAVSSWWEEAQLSVWELLSFGQKTLLYFYPKDDTPGCTVENKDFSELIDDFAKLWVVVVWVSRDSIDSHQKFIGNHDLRVDLISDPDLTLHKALWAYGEKNNYWKIVEWVIRSTYLLNRDWEIEKEWKWIRAKGHAERVLKELQS